MENTLNEEEKRKFTNTRTILVSPEKHKFLTYMKIEGNYKNIDEVVEILIEAYNKLRVMEKAEKLKKSKNGKTN